MGSGIYRILNKVNGKGYVGKASNLPVRWHGHKHHLRKGNHHSPHLQAAWNKYGADSFTFEILELVEDKTKLVEKEQYWIDFYDASNPAKGYNILSNANESRHSPHSDDTRKKIGDGNRGKIISLETRKKQSEALKGPKHKYFGKKLPKEWRDNIVKALIGRGVSDETKQKLHIANLGKGTGSKPQTIEYKKQIKDFIVKFNFKPSKHSKDSLEQKLGKILGHYTDKNSVQYDAQFTEEMSKYLFRKEKSIILLKEESLKFFKDNGYRPHTDTELGSFIGRQLSMGLDLDFINKVKPYITFEEHTKLERQGQILKFVSLNGYIPSACSKNLEERKLAKTFDMYFSVKSKNRDPIFRENFPKVPTWQQFRREQKVK